MKILLKNANVLDFFSNHIKTHFDILIHGSEIEAIDTNIEDKEASVIPVNGNIVAPGLIDVHVHFREPGQ
jgi:dihydroorotase